jgi:hypothetical protein
MDPRPVKVRYRPAGVSSRFREVVIFFGRRRGQGEKKRAIYFCFDNFGFLFDAFCTPRTGRAFARGVLYYVINRGNAVVEKGDILLYCLPWSAKGTKGRFEAETLGG